MMLSGVGSYIAGYSFDGTIAQYMAAARQRKLRNCPVRWHQDDRRAPARLRFAWLAWLAKDIAHWGMVLRSFPSLAPVIGRLAARWVLSKCFERAIELPCSGTGEE